MVKYYAILGHSLTRRENARRPLPAGTKLILSGKCGQVTQSDNLFQMIMFNKNTVQRYANNLNVTKNIKRVANTVGPHYFNRLNKIFKITRNGVVRVVPQGNYSNQLISFEPTTNEMTFGVFELPVNIRRAKPQNSLVKIRNRGFTYARLSQLMNTIKRNAKGENVAILGHFCRSVPGVNFPGPGSYKKINLNTGHSLSAKEFSRLATLRPITTKRQNVQRAVINTVASGIKHGHGNRVVKKGKLIVKLKRKRDENENLSHLF